MPLVRDCRFSAIDFESAGAAAGKSDAPVQVGVASWSLAGGHEDPFVSYIHTTQPILWSARKVHGIGPAELADAPSLGALWPALKTRLSGAVVVAHGKGTEKRFLRAFPGHGFGPWLDTLLLARAARPHLRESGLGALCAELGLGGMVAGLVAGRTWHDALFDAVASLVLLEWFIGDHQLAEFPVEALLQPDTSAWHRQRGD